MPTTIRELRWAYRAVFATALLLFYFAYMYCSMASEFIDGPPGAWQAFSVASTACTFAGLLGGVIAGGLRMIIQHIEALETALAKLVESDADPKTAAQALAAFLREVNPAETRQFPSAMRAIGSFFRRALGK